MSRVLPTHPGSKSPPGEIDLHRHFKSPAMPKDWTVLHSLDLKETKSERQCEIDFVVFIPDKGIMCIEVKSSLKVERNNDGMWKFGKQTQTPKSPFSQAEDGQKTLHRRLKKQFPEFSKVSQYSCVIFTHAKFNERSEEWHPWEFLDKDGWGEAKTSVTFAKWLKNSFKQNHQLSSRKKYDFEKLNRKQIDKIVDWLRPSFAYQEKPIEEIRRRDKEVLKTTKEQQFAIQLCTSNDQVVLCGPAGTGKTILATYMAEQWRKEKLNPIFLCYNKYLARSLRSQSASKGIDGSRIMTIHKAMSAFSPANGENSNDYWQKLLPDLAIEKLLEGHRPFGEIDSIVIDEAQDILHSRHYCDFLELLLGSSFSSSKCLFVGDFETQDINSEGQSAKVFETDSNRDLFCNFTHYSLSWNCRNTEHIGINAIQYGQLPEQTYSGYLSERSSLNNIKPEAWYSTDEEMFKKVQSSIKWMLKEGLKPNEIVLLSIDEFGLEERHKNRLKELDVEDWDLGGKKVRLSTIRKFKGLESKGVILFNSGKKDTGERLGKLLYTGCTRSTHRLSSILHENMKARLLL
jgi:DNA helicase IV